MLNKGAQLHELESGNLEPLHNKAEQNKCVGKEGKAKTTSQFYRHREHAGFITVLHEMIYYSYL